MLSRFHTYVHLAVTRCWDARTYATPQTECPIIKEMRNVAMYEKIKKTLCPRINNRRNIPKPFIHKRKQRKYATTEKITGSTLFAQSIHPQVPDNSPRRPHESSNRAPQHPTSKQVIYIIRNNSNYTRNSILNKFRHRRAVHRDIWTLESFGVIDVGYIRLPIRCVVPDSEMLVP